MAYKIKFKSYSGRGRSTTTATYKTKTEAKVHAGKMNKANPGMNARVVKR